jgi:hypothetical protein
VEVVERRKPLSPFQKVAAEAVTIVSTEARRTFSKGSGNQDSDWAHFRTFDNIKFSTRSVSLRVYLVSSELPCLLRLSQLTCRPFNPLDLLCFCLFLVSFTTYGRKLPSGLTVFRAEGQYLNCNPLEALLFLNNPSEYLKCDPNIDFQEKLEAIDADTNAVHLQFKPVWPASTRGMQFAMISKLVPLGDTHGSHELAMLSRDLTIEQLQKDPAMLERLNKGEFALVMGSKSITHPDATQNPKRKSICIGTDSGSGYFIYRDPSSPPASKGCRFVHIAQFDLQFPSLLTDNLISNYTHLISQARNYLDFMTAKPAAPMDAAGSSSTTPPGGKAATKVLEGWDICTGKKVKYQKDVSRSDSPGEILKAVGIPWVFRKVLGNLSGASFSVEISSQHTVGTIDIKPCSLSCRPTHHHILIPPPSAPIPPSLHHHSRLCGRFLQGCIICSFTCRIVSP